MSRSKRSQSAHNARVRKIAQKLERDGYDVQADVTGFPQPDTIRGYRPDVIAKKPGERKVIEVETPDSVGTARDEGQRKAFRQAADHSCGFRTYPDTCFGIIRTAISVEVGHPFRRYPDGHFGHSDTGFGGVGHLGEGMGAG